MMIYEKPKVEIIRFETENVMLNLGDLEADINIDMSQGSDEW